jgi:hypothetical protein
MLRYALFVVLVMASAATAIAAIAPPNSLGLPAQHTTIIHKNQAFPVIGPISVQACGVEDCSDAES